MKAQTHPGPEDTIAAMISGDVVTIYNTDNSRECIKSAGCALSIREMR